MPKCWSDIVVVVVVRWEPPRTRTGQRQATWPLRTPRYLIRERVHGRFFQRTRPTFMNNLNVSENGIGGIDLVGGPFAVVESDPGKYTQASSSNFAADFYLRRSFHYFDPKIRDRRHRS